MGYWKCHAFLAVFVALGASPAAGQQPKLTPQQQQDLKELQSSFQALPVLPQNEGQHLKGIEGGLQRILAGHNQPSRQATATLASTLFRDVNGGAVSVSQTSFIVEELAKALTQPVLTSQQIEALVGTIDPVVQRSNLAPPERMRLYRDVILTIQSSPAYVPR